jgi:hypothetical protein
MPVKLSTNIRMPNLTDWKGSIMLDAILEMSISGGLRGAAAACLILSAQAQAQTNGASEPIERGYPIPIPAPPTEPAAKPFLGLSLENVIERLGLPTSQEGDERVREVEYRAKGCRIYLLLTDESGKGLRVLQAVAQTVPDNRDFSFLECQSRILSKKDAKE